MKRLDIQIHELDSTDQMNSMLAMAGRIIGTRTDGTQWWIDVDETGQPMGYWALPPGQSSDPAIELRTPEQIQAWRDMCSSRDEIYADHPIHQAWEQFIAEQGDQCDE